jgi:hypothetical protein
MKKQMLRPLSLSRETLRRLDESPLAEAFGGGTAGSVCCTGITLTRPTVGDTCGTGNGGHGPQQR